MSLKKDRFNSFDKNNMRFAINLAINQNGLTGTNPSVGCVIVNNDCVVAAGCTSINGRPHAEINALKSNKNSFDSTLYTTLEPCVHYGKTSPCINQILKKKIIYLLFFLLFFSSLF